MSVSNNTTKRICLVIPSLQAGGMERVMVELAGNFSSRKGIEVHLILYDLSREIFYKVPQDVFIYKPTFDFHNRWRLFYTIKTLFFLRKSIKKINPITILSFGEYWNSFLLLSLIGLKYPVFVSDRSQPDKSLGRFHDLLRRRLYPKAKGLIFQTEAARRIFFRNNRHRNTFVIGNPVRQIPSLREMANREKVVLMVGRLIKTKHQDKLIEIFAKIDLPDWKLMLVGYDHLKQSNMERLRKLAEELGIASRVIFTGKVEDPKDYYMSSSVFAFTSSSEGFPNVIGEAMSAGLPVVAFDCIAGPSEMITDNHDGFLIPLFDYVGFQSKLIELMNNQELRSRFGANARESIKQFSSDNICEAFYEFITAHSVVKVGKI
ncbi:MAG: glycosyltransferase family 4 protein [Bacteroidales bacterium]|nr:glycosyltransferase family 4 protein [Bacteroidales bacterium]